MANVAKWAGLAAAAAWLLLAILTAGSSALDRNSIGINLVVAVIFLAVALLLLWRTVAVEATRRSMPKNEAIRSLLRVDAVTGVATLLVGVALLVMAGSRVFGEGMAVFG